MSSSWGRSAALLLAAASALVHAEPSAEPPKEDRPPPELRWVQGGARLMVGDRWLLDPARGTFSPLPYAPKPGENLQLSLDAAGERVAVVTGDQLRTGPVAGPLGAAVRIPRWLGPPPQGEGDFTTNLAFWISARQLLVHQSRGAPEPDARCRLLELSTRKWTKAPCPQGDFYQVWRLDPGPSGLVAIYTAGEGHPGLAFARYDAKQGQREVPSPTVDEYPFGPVWAQFSPDGARIHLATPCLLERTEPRPCEDLDEHAPWRLYTWSIPEKKLSLRAANLPEALTPDPRGDRIAWAESRRVCVAPLAEPGRSTCFPLPGP